MITDKKTHIVKSIHLSLQSESKNIGGFYKSKVKAYSPIDSTYLRKNNGNKKCKNFLNVGILYFSKPKVQKNV